MQQRILKTGYHLAKVMNKSMVTSGHCVIYRLLICCRNERFSKLDNRNCLGKVKIKSDSQISNFSIKVQGGSEKTTHVCRPTFSVHHIYADVHDEMDFTKMFSEYLRIEITVISYAFVKYSLQINNLLTFKNVNFWLFWLMLFFASGSSLGVVNKAY